MAETLQDDLRRRTRNFTSVLPEDEVFRLGLSLARELVRAHAENPPRHPDLDPAAVTLEAGTPRLTAAGSSTDESEDLFRLGALLATLFTGETPQISWRLDGPPPLALATIRRKAAMAALTAPRRSDRFASAAEATHALEQAAAPSASAAAASAEAAPSAGWTLFRGDAARTGVVAGPTPARLVPAWTLSVGPVVASPLILGDLVVGVSAEGRLVFVDRQSGRLLHETHLKTGVESSPCLGGTVLHVGTDEGALVTIDAVSGTELSRVTVGKLVRASPLPVGDRVLVSIVDAKGGGALAALSLAGKPAWIFKLGPAFSSPALRDDRVVVGSDAGRVHALDLASGKERWAADLGSKVRATPALAAGMVIVGTFGGRVAALLAEDGGPKWTAELGHAIYSSAAVAERLVALGCNEGHVHGLDPSTGAPIFATATGGPVVASPVICGEGLVAASTDGSLYLLGPDGAIRQALPLSPAGLQSSPAVFDGLLVVGSGEGLHAVRLES